MKFQLDILLSTYNGRQYLSEQVDSLLSQSFKHWKLLIRDDGSNDNTPDLIDQYVSKYPDKIIRVEDELGNVGTSQSFSILISQSDAAYVALCDQDDVWITEKLAIQMDRMLDEESSQSSELPILINTDLKVADHQLNILSSSLWQYQNLSPHNKANLCHLLVQNHMTGCTFLMNRALVDVIQPISEKAIMHDWWIALIATTRGKIVSVNVATVLYRQHSDNVFGAVEWSFAYVMKEFPGGLSRCRKRIEKTKNQAEAFLNNSFVSGESGVTIKKYIELFNMGWFERRKVLIKEDFLKQGFLRNFVMLICI